MKQYKVLLHGYFQHNLGDDLFFRAIATRYPDVKFYIPILTSGYKEKFKDLPNIVVVDFWGIAKYVHHKTYILPKFYSCITMSRYDAVVCIGGSLFMDRKNPTKNDVIEIENYSFIADWEWAYKKGVPYFVIGANWGPVYNEFFEQYFTRAIKTLHDLCFRDSASYNHFKNMPNVRRSGDILLGNPMIKQAVTGVEKKRKVAISVVNARFKNEIVTDADLYEQKISEWATELINDGYEVFFMSFCKAEGDEEAIRRIAQQMPSNKGIRVLCYNHNWQEMLNNMAESEFILASRFHATVLGWTVGTPVYSLAYSLKTLNLLKDCMAERSCSLINNIEKISVSEIKKQAYLLKNVEVVGGANDAFSNLDMLLSK